MANAASVWQALGDSTRRNIFERLAKRPMAVVDIADELPVSRPAVSQHLKILKDAGIVVVSRDGTRRIYHVNPKAVEAMRQYLDRLWDKAVESFKVFAERKEEQSDSKGENQ